MVMVPVRLGNRTIGVNLGIFTETTFWGNVSSNAAPTGLDRGRDRFSTQMPSLRD